MTVYTCTYCEEEITADQAHVLVLEQEKKDRDARLMTPEQLRNHAATRDFLVTLSKGIEKQLGTWFDTTPEPEPSTDRKAPNDERQV